MVVVPAKFPKGSSAESPQPSGPGLQQKATQSASSAASSTMRDLMTGYDHSSNINV